MNSRNLMMLVLVAVLGAGAWLVTHRKAPTTDITATPLYPELINQVNEAERVTIESNDGTVTVARHGEGWLVESLDQYPAQAANVKQLLVQLGSLKVLETKTGKAENYPQLEVEDRAPNAKSRLVKVSAAKDTPLVELLVGKERAARAMNAPAHYVRRAGEANAFLAEGDLTIGTKGLDWVDSSVVNIPVERVRQVSIKPADGKEIVVSKEKPEDQLFTLANLPAGFEVRARATVSSMGGILLDARFDKVISRQKLGAATPTAVATIQTFDGLTATVERYMFEDAGYVTLRFTHTPDSAVTPAASATPADQPKSEAPASSTLKKPDEVAKEATEFNALVDGWAYLLPDYKTRLLEKNFDELIKKAEAKTKPAAQ